MFELFFGMFWTAITAFITWGFYGTTGDVSVNGTLVSHEEFSAMLMPKIFIGIFWVIGIFMLFKGIIKIIKDTSTNMNGEECFGRICDIYPSGARVNGRPEFKADFLVYIPSTQETTVISEKIGFNRYKYSKGYYVRLKYYNGDINIEEIIDDEYRIPSDAKHELDKSDFFEADSKETIIVDGIEYIRKDLV